MYRVGLALLFAVFAPSAASAAVHGSLDHDAAFADSFAFIAQNLGNGNFTQGAAVTGVDFVASTTADNSLYVRVMEYDMLTRNQTTSYSPMQDPIASVNGEHLYHVDFAPFTPHSDRCYLLFVGANLNRPLVFYGSTHETYTASSNGCHPSDLGN